MAKSMKSTQSAAKSGKAATRAKPVPKPKAKVTVKAVPSKAKSKPVERKPVAKTVVAKKAVAKKAAAKAPVAKKPVANKAVAKKTLATAKPSAATTAGKSGAKLKVASPAPAKPKPKPVVAAAKPRETAVKASKAPTPAPIPSKNTPSSVIESTTASPAAPRSKNSVKTVSSTKLKGVTMQDGRYALPATTIVELPAGYRPSSKEEYMNPSHLEYFRRKLQSWREDLVEESKQTIENLRDEVRDVGDEAERATRETENSLELRTRDRYRKLISKIDKALKRIEEGRYGFCEETDEDIGIDRLDARPIATLCLDAQERWEHRQKQMGD